jgi:glycosyltransferase involved in cell wall biosynthesis
MRIAQVIGSFDGGGAQRQAYNLMVALEEQGVVSRGIAVRRAGRYVEPQRAADVVSLGADRRAKLSQISAMLRLRKVIREWRLDVLHVQGTGCLPLVVASVLGMRSRPRVLFTWQNSETVLSQTGVKRQLMVWAMKRCDALFGSSHRVAELLQQSLGGKNVGVFHGGVPVRPVAIPDPAQPPVIVWLGRFTAAKNPQALVRAAAALHREGLDFRVVMVGEAFRASDALERTRQLIQETGLQNVVQTPGWLADENLDRLLSSASIRRWRWTGVVAVCWCRPKMTRR